MKEQLSGKPTEIGERKDFSIKILNKSFTVKALVINNYYIIMN